MSRRLGPWLGRLAVASIYAFLLAPIVVVVGVSFDATGRFLFPPRALSLHWYVEFFASQTFVRAFFGVSLVNALLVSVAATVLGGLASIALVRFRGPGATAVETLLLLPIVVPEILLGAALFLFYSRIALRLGVQGLFLGHSLIALPYVIRVGSAGLTGVPRSLEEAARTLGASPTQAFVRVTLPVIRSSLLSAAVFAFIVSFSDINLALFIAGPNTVTLPVQIFSQMMWQGDPTVAAASTLQIALIAALLVLAQRAGRLRLTL